MVSKENKRLIIKLKSNIESPPLSFVLLLGSGISKSAGIPTGWWMTLELIKKIMLQSNPESSQEPEKWFKDKYSQDVTFSGVFDKFTDTKNQECMTIKEHFLNREPTAAHEKIALLMRKNIIKIVITTNYDRLLEDALARIKCHPLIIKSIDDSNNFKPLHLQMEPIIIKLCGDITDCNIKTSNKELEEIDDKFIDLLNKRIFNDHHLLICGWSANYDKALRQLILDNYDQKDKHVYWVNKSLPSGKTKDISDKTDAKFIPTTADNFFKELVPETNTKEIQEIRAEVFITPPGISHSRVEYKMLLKNIRNWGRNIEYIDVDFVDEKLGSSITNNFNNRRGLPSPTSVPFYNRQGYSYSRMSSPMIVPLGKHKLRVHIDTQFYDEDSNYLSLVFSDTSCLSNTEIPGYYRLKLSINGKTEVNSEPFQIEDTPTSVKIAVGTPIVAHYAEYQVTFRNGDYPLSALKDTITIAFPVGTTIPYSAQQTSQGLDFIKIKRHAPFSRFKKIPIAPTVQGQDVTVTCPIDIKPNQVIRILFSKNLKIKNPYTPELYQIQVKTSRQNAYAVSTPYAIIPDDSTIDQEKNED